MRRCEITWEDPLADAGQGRTQQLRRVDITDGSGRLIAHGKVRLQNVADRP